MWQRCVLALCTRRRTGFISALTVAARKPTG